MTQEDKDLLLKDLSARLPYGVICRRLKNAYEVVDINIKRGVVYLLRDETYVPYSISAGDEINPYLRPMSSMTEEELKIYHSYCECDDGDFTGEILYFDTIESFDYLTSIHIDYRGLIPMGLAIEVTEENNPYKK